MSLPHPECARPVLKSTQSNHHRELGRAFVHALYHPTDHVGCPASVPALEQLNRLVLVSSSQPGTVRQGLHLENLMHIQNFSSLAIFPEVGARGAGDRGRGMRPDHQPSTNLRQLTPERMGRQRRAVPALSHSFAPIQPVVRLRAGGASLSV